MQWRSFQCLFVYICNTETCWMWCIVSSTSKDTLHARTSVSVEARTHYLELMQLMHACLPTTGASLVAAVTHQLKIVRSGTQTLAESG